MEIETKQGMNTRGFYELREGRCPTCGTLFDDIRHSMQPDDSRWCPGCNCYKLGRIKGKGEITPKRG